MVIDGTDFKVHELSNLTRKERKKWYSHKFKSAGVKYEVGMAINTGDIVHFIGPFRGAVADITIFRSYLKGNLMKGERTINDRGYRGDRKCVTPYDAVSKQHARAMSVLRCRLENVNGRLKEFKCLKETWRQALRHHHRAFRACLVLVQLKKMYGTAVPFLVTGYTHPVDDDFRSLASGDDMFD